MTSILMTEIFVFHDNNNSFPDAELFSSTCYIRQMAKELEGSYIKANDISVSQGDGVITILLDISQVSYINMILNPT